MVGERAVKYNDKIMKLSPLAYEIFADKGRLNKSGAYQGANYFSYRGVKLTQMPDKNSDNNFYVVCYNFFIKI